ncbi:MAG: squalene/phytoene synthase family protein [Ktedonobacterales bacterium]
MIHEPTTLMHSQSGEVLQQQPQFGMHEPDREASLALPELITRSASKQAYYTVRFLADRDRTLDAYRAYAYFRWLDDQLDQPVSERAKRLAFVERQQAVVDWSYHSGQPWSDLTREERMLADLIQSDNQDGSGLQSYISNMMAVMAFDANRRGRLVSEVELEEYTQHLSIAVTDALHYFIGHTYAPPRSASRYFPAMAAHMTHMLRDTFEDNALGYFNVPCEVLTSSGIDPRDVESASYREWVKGRVQLARSYFKAGAGYLDQVKSVRCRLAGYAYMARFAGVLDAIEREGYQLRPAYPEFMKPAYALRVGASVVLNTLLRGTE